jgi:hypothetical protein
VTVYVLPVVKPVITIGEDEPVAVIPPVAVARYPVIGKLPSLVGAVKVTDIDVVLA